MMLQLLHVRCIKYRMFCVILLCIQLCSIFFYVHIRCRNLISKCQEIQDVIKTKTELEKHCEALLILESRLQKHTKHSIEQLSRSRDYTVDNIQDSNDGLNEMVQDYLKNINAITAPMDSLEDQTKIVAKDTPDDIDNLFVENDDSESNTEKDSQDNHGIVENQNQDKHNVENSMENLESDNDDLSNDTNETNSINEDQVQAQSNGHIITPVETSEPCNDTYPSTRQLQQRYPKAIIIGMAKCGTDALRNTMLLNPMLKSTNQTELCFFGGKNTLEWYRSYMPYTLPEQVTFTKCPSVFKIPWSFREMHKFRPEMRIIVVLCDPVKHLVSRYLMSQELKKEKFMEPLPALEPMVLKPDGTVKRNNEILVEGVYVWVLNRVYKYFPHQQVHIVYAENFIKDPVDELNQIEDFLGVPRLITRSMFLYNHTKDLFTEFMRLDGSTYTMRYTKGRPHPKMEEIFYDRLHEFYKPFNEKLFAVIGRTLEWNYRGKNYTSD